MKTYKTRGALNEILRLQANVGSSMFAVLKRKMLRMAGQLPSASMAHDLCVNIAQDMDTMIKRETRIKASLADGRGKVAQFHSKNQFDDSLGPISGLRELGDYLDRMPEWKQTAREMWTDSNVLRFAMQNQLKITAMLQRINGS